MRKIFCVVTFLMTATIGITAQKLGDYIEFDGVPAFIIHLDETGQHGVAMSMRLSHAKFPKKITQKHVEKLGLLSIEQAIQLKNKIENIGIGKLNFGGAGGKWSKDLFVDLVGRLTDSGKTNQEQIISYCKEKGLSLKETFPLQYFAQELGEGWYIPGDRELMYFAEFYCGGLNVDFNINAGVLTHEKKLTDVPALRYAIWYIALGTWSSSCHFAEDGFRVLVRDTKGNMFNAKSSLRIVDSYTNLMNGKKLSKGSLLPYKMGACAVHDF